MYNGYAYAICIQVSSAVAVITTCVLQFQQFFVGLQTGMFFTTDTGRAGLATVAHEGSASRERKGYLELSGIRSRSGNVELQHLPTSAQSISEG